MVDNTAFTGKHGSLLVGVETSYATGGTADRDIGLMISISVEETSEFVECPSVGARNNQANVRTAYNVKLSIEGTYQHSRLLYYALGAVSTTGGSDPYTHTITEADVIPSLKVQYCKSNAATGNQRLIIGARLNTLALSVDNGSVLKFTADFIGQKVTFSDSTASQTIDDILPPGNPQVDVQLGADDSEPTVTVTAVQGFDLNIDNGLIVSKPINSVTITEAIAGNRRYSGTLRVAESAGATTVELIKRVLGTSSSTTPDKAQTRNALELYWTNGLTPVDSIKIVLYGVSFGGATAKSVPGELDILEIPFVAESLGSCSGVDDIADASF